MEKKSIGQFISALRKANGMTQKQLSELLNVSDKAVSRWERDECAPDLTLIPVIADLFGVTSDEILRGERRSFDTSEVDSAEVSVRSVKQMEHMLNSVVLKFNIRGVISSGIAFVGILCAMLFNYGLFLAHIGFISACVFYLAAIVCQIIFTKLAFSSVAEVDFMNEKVELCKKALFNGTLKVCFLIYALFSATLPLVVLVPYSNMKLNATSWFIYGCVFLVFSLFICALIRIFGERIALRSNIYSLTEKETVIADKKFRLDVKYLMILLGVVFISVVAHIVFAASFSSVEMVSEGKKFDSVESFVRYAETPAKPSVFDYSYESWELLDPNGEVLTTFTLRNGNVSSWSTEWDSDDIVITVYTVYDMEKLYSIGNFINSVFIVIYIAEVLVIAVLWCVRKKKIK